MRRHTCYRAGCGDCAWCQRLISEALLSHERTCPQIAWWSYDATTSRKFIIVGSCDYRQNTELSLYRLPAPLLTWRSGSVVGWAYQRSQSIMCRVPLVVSWGWLGGRVVSVLDSGAEGPGFKSQPRRFRVTVLGKLFTPIVPLFTKQRNW